MNNSRTLMLLTMAIITTAVTTDTPAQSAGAKIYSVAELRAPSDSGADSLRSNLTSGALGLKPQSGSAKRGIDLPYGMNYNSETRSLMMPLDEKSEWGVGLNLNVNSLPNLEQSPSSGIGLQPKRVPGVMLQKRF